MEELGDSVPDMWARIYDSSVTPDPDLVPMTPSDKSLVWLLVALNAHPSNVPQWFQKNIVEYDYFTGYNLTHQFATLVAQEFIWEDYDFGSERATRLDELARRIADEEDSACVSDENCCVDLYAERIHFLIIAGYEGLVKREWVQRLLDARLENGLWSFYSIENKHSWHPTHLGMWAVASYQGILQRGEEERQDMVGFIRE